MRAYLYISMLALCLVWGCDDKDKGTWPGNGC